MVSQPEAVPELTDHYMDPVLNGSYPTAFSVQTHRAAQRPDSSPASSAGLWKMTAQLR